MRSVPRGAPVALIVASFAESVVSFRGALIEALANQGVQVHVCAPFAEADDGAVVNVRGATATLHRVPVARGGMNPVADLLFCMRVAKLARRIRPHFVLSYTVKPVIYGTIAAWACDVPRRYALVTGLGYAFGDAQLGLLRRIVEAMYRFALGRAHKTFFQNPDDERLFRQRGILGPGASAVVVDGSGVDVDEYPVAPLRGGAPSFLMIARLLGAKGVREYAAAARRVREIHPAARFELAGWIDESPDAIAASELEKWLGNGDVSFLGRLDDVRPAIERCSVYVLPSYREGTPRTVLEAMAMGRPIVTTDVPGCRETVLHGENGLLVPARDAAALTAAMLDLIESGPGVLAAMGLRSRLLVESRYDVRKVNRTMLREMGVGTAAEGQGNG